uniref:Carboxylic ester hydrolase n=1 Tax=Pristhesancus plagipennis TaxID=1955184 RepID=A0A2K8JP03_PRIPG|nr:secreted Esterase/lipase protein [Pristhesancus plagipennis]
MLMMLLKLTICLLLSIYLCECVSVQTKLGKLKGAERKSRDGKTYYAFIGIPFAKPPVGKLRLKNPEHIEPWHEELDVSNESPQIGCYQIGTIPLEVKNKVFGQEDCLYLSVYTPDLKPKEKLAVLVYIHGGAFRWGGEGPKYNAGYLIDGNVILVNIHYRLGALGFLSTEDEYIPGNFGLKDQAMALQWIKDNIESFGGDNEKITIFGISAGGTSTHYHMMSPLSKGILKGVITQSGWINPFWGVALPGTARPMAKVVAEVVGCQDYRRAELLECLQNADVEKLAKSEQNFTYWDTDPAVVFRPVQEREAEGAFMTFDPFTQETTLPWITGTVSSEGIFKYISLASQDDSVTQQFIDNMNDYLHRFLSLDASCPQAVETVKLVRERYFPEPITVKSTQSGMRMLFGDAYFLYPMAMAMKKHKGPMYQYLYDYRSGSSISDITGNFGDIGVSHGDDQFPLFNMTEYFPKQKPGDEEVSRTMVQLWTNFAKYHKPTLEEDQFVWPKYDSKAQYLHIAKTLSVGQNLKEDVIDWWFKLPAFSNSFI